MRRSHEGGGVPGYYEGERLSDGTADTQYQVIAEVLPADVYKGIK